MEPPRKLWEHPDPSSTSMYAFMQEVNQKYQLNLKTFEELYQFSISRRSDFWALIFAQAGYIYEGSYTRVVDESQPVDAVPRWFDGVRLNYAENLLYTRFSAEDPTQRSTRGKEDDKVAVTEVREGLTAQRDVTWAELRTRSAQLAAAMAGRGGVRRGDRVVLVGGNSVETLLVWLATCWLGGLFSSSSTDMGASGILQRGVQVQPRLVFMDDAAVYNGKTVNLVPKMADVSRGLRDAKCAGFGGIVSIPRFSEPRDVSSVPQAIRWADFIAGYEHGPPPPFTRIDFADPFLIGFSSGTTGTPKAIVHSVGGLLVSYYKEARLHEGLSSSSVCMQYTTTGWIMYVAAVAPLLYEARVVLYDGSPFVPDKTILVRIASQQRVTKFGTSPRWLQELKNDGLNPRDLADLSSLQTVTCTGMVLADELQHWFYDAAFPAHVQLANISGGTDIAGCFGLSNPLTPLYVGGSQGPSLAVDIRVFDTTAPDDGDGFIKGIEVAPGEPGELVAVQAFPNVPTTFWNDPGSRRVQTHPESGDMILDLSKPAAPPGSRYHDAYFARFRHVWAHGDFVSIHPRIGRVDFLGRADGVLNPSGVRFGSAEVYAVVDRHPDRFAARGVVDTLCVGQRRPGRDIDESVVLFVLLKPDAPPLDAALAADLRAAISADLSKRHVPRYIFQTPALPVTINMKKVELPVKRILNGEKITPSGTLANPESLDFFYPFVEIEQMEETKAKL